MKLPARMLQISPSAERRLHSGEDEFVPAVLRTGRSPERVVVGHRGGHTRHYPKKSYEIRIGSRTVHYNAEWDDPAMMRNALSFYFFERLGVPSPRTRHVTLFMNGVSQGVYLEIEGVDRSFFTKRRVKVGGLLYAVNNNANFRLNDEFDSPKASLASGYETVIGGSEERRRLASFVERIHSLSGRSLENYLATHLHIPQYLRWLAGAVCTGNYDGFEQNYALYRRSGSLRYQISPWDYEGTWGRDCYGEESSSRTVRISGYNGLTEKLLKDPVIRRRYKRLLQYTLQKHFTKASLEPVIRSMHAKLAPSLLEDRTRRHSSREVLSDPEVILTYIKKRRAYILSELAKL
jgi:spore coat protein H